VKEIFAKPFVRAVLIAVVSAAIVAGGVYAYETLWSGRADIIIEPPTGEGHVVVTQVSVTAGSYSNDTGIWTVSIPRGGHADLIVYLRNDGGDAIVVNGAIDGETDYYPADGVHIFTGSAETIAGGDTGDVVFRVFIEADAEPGELPAIQLEIGH